MRIFNKFSLLVVAMLFCAPLFAEQDTTYRNVIYYPYHAAPYYMYSFTNGFGYNYSRAIVNAEYTHPHNDRDIVVYPDGPYQQSDYYQVNGSKTICYQHAHQVICSY